MPVSDILSLIGQYGVFPVLLCVLGYAYDKKDRQSDAERASLQAKFDEQLRLQRAACQNELQKEREFYAEAETQWRREREGLVRDQQASFNREREAGERFVAQLLESQRNMTQVINQASQMAGAFESEKREIREERQRELRDSGQRPPYQLPPGKR